MFKYKKIAIYLSMILYIVLYLVEFIKYLIIDNTLFGLYYLLIELLIIFLLVPCVYNYKRYYSSARISKLIMIIILGIFNSYILEFIVLNSMSYVDSSKEYIRSIFIYKNIFKGLIYIILTIITILEFKVEKVLSKNISNKKLD